MLFEKCRSEQKKRRYNNWNDRTRKENEQYLRIISGWPPKNTKTKRKTTLTRRREKTNDLSQELQKCLIIK